MIPAWRSAAAGVALIAGIIAPDAADRGFGVALLRRDGALIPFATYAGKRGRNPWPAPPRQPLEPVEILPVDGPDARGLAPALLEAFNRSERVTEGRYGHPVSRRNREDVGPKVEGLYAFGTAPRVYYVEAVRRYRLLG